MTTVVSPALARRVRALAIAAPILVTSRISAQRPAKDSTRADTSRAQRLERVMISAVRASGAAPISACVATASLKTAFMLVGGSTDPIQLRATSTWQCNGARLVTP